MVGFGPADSGSTPDRTIPKTLKKGMKIMNDENSAEIRQQILKALGNMPYPKYYYSDKYRDVKKELGRDRAKNCAD